MGNSLDHWATRPIQLLGKASLLGATSSASIRMVHWIQPSRRTYGGEVHMAFCHWTMAECMQVGVSGSSVIRTRCTSCALCLMDPWTQHSTIILTSAQLI